MIPSTKYMQHVIFRSIQCGVFIVLPEIKHMSKSSIADFRQRQCAILQKVVNSRTGRNAIRSRINQLVILSPWAFAALLWPLKDTVESVWTTYQYYYRGKSVYYQFSVDVQVMLSLWSSIAFQGTPVVFFWVIKIAIKGWFIICVCICSIQTPSPSAK